MSNTSCSPIVTLSVNELFLALRHAIIYFGGKPDQCIRDFDGKGHSGFEVAQSFGQAFEIMRGPRPDLGQRGRWSDAMAILHDRLDQWFAGMGIGFERQNIAGHSVRPVHIDATPVCGQARLLFQTNVCGAAARRIPGAYRRNRAPAGQRTS